MCPRSSLACSLAACLLCLIKEMLSSKPGPVDLLLSLPLGPQTRHKVSKGIKSSSRVTLRTAMAEGRE